MDKGVFIINFTVICILLYATLSRLKAYLNSMRVMYDTKLMFWYDTHAVIVRVIMRGHY